MAWVFWFRHRKRSTCKLTNWPSYINYIWGLQKIISKLAKSTQTQKLPKIVPKQCPSFRCLQEKILNMIWFLLDLKDILSNNIRKVQDLEKKLRFWALLRWVCRRFESSLGHQLQSPDCFFIVIKGI